MSRIVFESERPLIGADPVRADVACFVGLARRLDGAALPPAVMDWLVRQGWTAGPFSRPLNAFFDIPIPIENYGVFQSLFDTGGSAASTGTEYLAAAVRTFFAQGGKRCYIVRMGDPVAVSDTAGEKSATLGSLLPSAAFVADDQRGWHGAGHVAGLPDVSFIALPDLPALCASTPVAAQGAEPAPAVGPVRFEECTGPTPEIPEPPRPGFFAPRLTRSTITRRGQGRFGPCCCILRRGRSATCCWWRRSPCRGTRAWPSRARTPRPA